MIFPANPSKQRRQGPSDQGSKIAKLLKNVSEIVQTNYQHGSIE